jgi:hypothetical protein
MQHHPTHWIAVALASALALLAFEAAGQSTNAKAVFEGRPTLAGAQAGLGAQAGPPQGGIGLEGSEATAFNLRRPRIMDEPRDMPQGAPAVVASLDADRVLPQRTDTDISPKEARELARRTR